MGLTRAIKEDYDLIILDLMLPKVDGFEICRQIRLEKDIPILMITAMKGDIDIIRGLGLGADDYMTKPFSPSEMVARVKAHIARYDRLVGGVTRNQDRMTIRGLTIDKASRRVLLNEQEIIFTTKEFELLAYLAANLDRVLSKDMIFERVWGMDAAGDVATVTVHIGKIREKIEADPSSPQYIETIWGVGYRFIA
ncbi:DNA-binding response regulator, OmpR family, contains REC and winged-helix (wHTH) domain [Paenibacillus macquariensis]|uniref:DNA-binding response regulator, OmpR family, contains REC and winged-helix (WHTH) domain n=1 Tax=Paenibacillus macquariensis TaxID=948756 RepID=A0ABY1KAZ2_9BACL|nr:DNA-binding response regulator, OmpR family, contains REC and winged-helix (wHTH) domain [Paenibacillus macquariensis]